MGATTHTHGHCRLRRTGESQCMRCARGHLANDGATERWNLLRCARHQLVVFAPETQRTAHVAAP